MNKQKAEEQNATLVQSAHHIALLCSLQERMTEHLKKMFREIKTAQTLGQCKRDMLKE